MLFDNAPLGRRETIAARLFMVLASVFLVGTDPAKDRTPRFNRSWKR